MHWFKDNWQNWLTLIPFIGALIGMIRIIVGKILSLPMLRFKVIPEPQIMSAKQNIPSGVLILMRITSEPLGGLAGTIFKRRDIQQAKVRAQCKYNDSVLYDEILSGYPDELQMVSILANSTAYDFRLVSKQQGYLEAYLECASDTGYHTKGLLPNADILCLVSVMEGEHTLGQVSCIIHNPDKNIHNFKVDCPSGQLVVHKGDSQN